VGLKGSWRRLLAPRSWLRLPHRTARLRLSLLYAAMFFVSGTCVLALVYLASAGSATIAVHVHRGGGPTVTPSGQPVPARGVVITPATGNVLGSLVSSQHSADLKRQLAVSLVALVVTTLASALFGWIAAGRVLRPLRTITATARTISAGNLHERLALAGPSDEFKQLGDTLDDLLGRLEASFEAQRRFVANASHELRTPLTLERTLLQLALSDPNATVQSLRSTCAELLASGQDQERLLEGLLTLASSERGLERRERLDLARVAAQILSSTRPESERLGLLVDSELAPAPLSGDRALIERLVSNLLDNAVRYNRPGGRIEVRTSTDGEAGRALLKVTNTGPAIAPEDVGRLFEPFQRLLADRTGVDDGGHGLGLSIVRAIATAHDATITAEPQPEGGLAVSVSFPAALELGS
jgi:signal transduction histidine kinase